MVKAPSRLSPTDAPEADGTIAWDATMLVLVEVTGGGKTGLGYTYASSAAREVVNGVLAEKVVGQDAFDIPRLWISLVRAVRNRARRAYPAAG